MADPNVFAQYMQRPKSVMEYMAEADEQDMQRRRNALEELAMQDKMAARQQAGVDRQWFEQIARQSGGDQKRLVQELRASGRMPLVQQAGQMEKEALEVEAKGADVAAKQYELERKKYTDSVQQLLAFTSPDDAIADLQGAVQRGDVKPEQAEQMLASMPRDQGQFLQWRSQTLLGLVSAKDRMEQEFKDRQLAQQKADAEAGRRVTMRGQDSQAETARQNRLSQERQARGQVTYQTDADGNMVALPTRAGPGDVIRAQPVVAAVGMQPMRGKPSEAVQKERLSINQQRAVVQGAIDAVKATPGAFSFMRGAATMIGPMAETLAGRTDSDDEIAARSYVYNNVSKVINERAGAAQSAQELARLRGFLPAEQDDARQINAKLEAFMSYLDDLEQGTGTSKKPPAAPAKPEPQTKKQPSVSNW